MLLAYLVEFLQVLLRLAFNLGKDVHAVAYPFQTVRSTHRCPCVVSQEFILQSGVLAHEEVLLRHRVNHQEVSLVGFSHNRRESAFVFEPQGGGVCHRHPQSEPSKGIQRS